MDIAQQFVRSSREDRARFDRLASWRSPAIPEAGECEQIIVIQSEVIRLLCLARSLPLVEAICRYQTPSAAELVSKSRLLHHHLAAGID